MSEETRERFGEIPGFAATNFAAGRVAYAAWKAAGHGAPYESRPFDDLPPVEKRKWCAVAAISFVTLSAFTPEENGETCGQIAQQAEEVLATMSDRRQAIRENGDLIEFTERWCTMFPETATDEAEDPDPPSGPV